MIEKLYIRVLNETFNYTKALSLNKKKISKNQKVWALYSLGMYESVTKFDTRRLRAKAMVGKIVSHAACGDFDTVRKLIPIYKKQKNYDRYIVKLADSLSPYMLQESIELLKEKKVDPLYSAILLNLGQVNEANQRLNISMKNKIYRNKPEILLYYSNTLQNVKMNTKVKFLNMYFNLFNIPKVKLKEEDKALNVMNLECNINREVKSQRLITILMTSYNVGNRINFAINSIVNQTYKNFELIIIDDASTDTQTIDIIKDWSNKDKRIKPIFLKKNVGTYVAKNIGLLKSKGEFITCHDSDDWSHPIKLERQVKPLIDKTNLIATISNWVRLDDYGNYYARPVHPLSRQNPSSLMFRKDIVLKEAGLWDCVRTGADSEFIVRLKLIFGRLRVKRIKEPLSLGAHREDSLMTAKDTGYSSKGMSPERLEYWESWNKWHIDSLSNKRNPFVDLDLTTERNFQAPDRIVVPIEDIRFNLVDNNL